MTSYLTPAAGHWTTEALHRVEIMANNALSIFFQDIEYPQERKHIFIFYDIYHSGFSECNIMIEMSEK